MFSTQGDYLHVNYFSLASDVGHGSMQDEQPMGEKHYLFFLFLMSAFFERKNNNGTND